MPDETPVDALAEKTAAPAPTPAAPVVEQAPAAKTAAPATTSTASAAEDIPEIGLDTPIQYDIAGSDVPAQHTLAELIEAKSQLSGLGDLDQLKTLVGAMNQDPEATKKLYEQQLASLSAKGDTGEKLSEREQLLMDRIERLETVSEKSSRLNRMVEVSELNSYLGTILDQDSVKGKFQWLVKDREVGVREIKRFISQGLATAGLPLSQLGSQPNILAGAFHSANQYIQTVASPFGGTVEQLAQQLANGQAVPEAGGQVPMTTPTEAAKETQKKYSRDGFLDRIRQKRAAQDGAMQ